jgi:hypothetical protein
MRGDRAGDRRRDHAGRIEAEARGDVVGARVEAEFGAGAGDVAGGVGVERDRLQELLHLGRTQRGVDQAALDEPGAGADLGALERGHAGLDRLDRGIGRVVDGPRFAAAAGEGQGDEAEGEARARAREGAEHRPSMPEARGDDRGPRARGDLAQRTCSPARERATGLRRAGAPRQPGRVLVARSGSMTAVLALAVCTGEVPTPETGPVVVPTPEEPARARADAPVDHGDLAGLMRTLAGWAVRRDAPVRKVLYTWTTRAQTEELRARPVLLTREVADGGEVSRFDAALADAPGPVPELLRKPGRRARRFAWPLPWATVMGWDGTGWGTDLVRVELKPEAITAVFSPGEPWQFLDLEGRHVELRAVLAAPERLAVVYHVAPASAERPGLREHVIVGEQMIASWSLGTEEIRAAIAADAEALAGAAEKIDAIRALAATRCEAEGAASCPEAELPEGPGEIAAWSGRLIAGPWARAPAAGEALLADLYAACLAVPGPAYVPTGVKIRAMVDRLRALVGQPPPLVVTSGLADTSRPSAKKLRGEAKSDRCAWDLSMVGCPPRRGGR